MTPTTVRKFYLVLCGNAVLLALVLASTWARTPPAAAQFHPAADPASPPPGGGMSIMPAQLSPNVFGCYLLDAEHQAICVYSYQPGTHDLRIEAARDVEYDRGLKSYNTSPPPSDMRRLEDRFNQLKHAPPAAPAGGELDR